MSHAHTASPSVVRLIIDGGDLFINEDATYRSNLLLYINTIVNRHFKDQHPKIYLEIHHENSIILINITAPEERSNA